MQGSVGHAGFRRFCTIVQKPGLKVYTQKLQGVLGFKIRRNPGSTLNPNAALQVQRAFEYLQRSGAAADVLDLRYDVSVTRKGSSATGRGVYMRHPADTTGGPVTFVVNVKPEVRRGQQPQQQQPQQHVIILYAAPLPSPSPTCWQCHRGC